MISPQVKKTLCNSISFAGIFIKDFGVLCLSFTVLYYLKLSFYFPGKYRIAEMAFTEGALLAIPCYLIWIIFFRILGSRKLLFLTALILNIVFTSYLLYTAHFMHLTEFARGHAIYIKGKLTFWGGFHETLNSATLFTIFSGLLYMSHNMKSIKCMRWITNISTDSQLDKLAGLLFLARLFHKLIGWARTFWIDLGIVCGSIFIFMHGAFLLSSPPYTPLPYILYMYLAVPSCYLYLWLSIRIFKSDLLLILIGCVVLLANIRLPVHELFFNALLYPVLFIPFFVTGRWILKYKCEPAIC